jgi:hypothetical protein
MTPLLRRPLPLLALPLLLPLAACDLFGGDDDDGDGTIRRVLITEIAIDDAPLTAPDGDGWDNDISGGGPDIYVELVNADTGSLVESFLEHEFPNVDQQDFPLEYDLDTDPDHEPITFTRFNTELAFDLWDEDPQLTKGDDDFMGSTESFNLQSLVDGDRPTFLRIDSADGEISVSIRLRYES